MPFLCVHCNGLGKSRATDVDPGDQSGRRGATLGRNDTREAR